MSDIISALEHIRFAAEWLEENPGILNTRDCACRKLAWHHLVDAHALLTIGRLTPDNMLWAQGIAEKLANAPDHGERK